MKTSITFRLLKKLHLIENEEKHGRINPFSLIWFAFKTMWRRIIFTYAYKAYIFEFAYKHHLRPAIWRALGCKVGKRVMSVRFGQIRDAEADYPLQRLLILSFPTMLPRWCLPLIFPIRRSMILHLRLISSYKTKIMNKRNIYRRR